MSCSRRSTAHSKTVKGAAIVGKGSTGGSMASSSVVPTLPAGARVISSTNASITPTETFSRAPPELVDLRVTRLLPLSTQRAKERLTRLKQLFIVPRATVKAVHARAIQNVVGHMRLTKSVRNVKRVNEGDDSVVGSLCLPFYSCAALASPAGGEACGGPLLATGSVDGLLTVWDTASCRPLCSTSTCVEGGSWGRVRSLVSHPTAPVCFSTTMFDRRIRAWKLGSEGRLPPVANEETETTAKNHTSGAGWSLAMAAATTATEGIEAGHVARINRLAVDPTGTLLASTSDDTTVRLWDIRRLDDAAPQTLSITARNLQKQQQQHATAADGSLDLPLLATHDGYAQAGAVLGVSFHPDGALVSTADAGGRVVTWDTRTGQLAFVTAGSQRGGHLDRATCVAWSPCGVRLASAGADHVVQLWDARMVYKTVHSQDTAEERKAAAAGSAPFIMLGHDDVVTSLGFYTDVRAAGAEAWRDVMPVALVSTSLDGTVRFWDADTGLCARTLYADGPVYDHCRLRAHATGHGGEGASSSPAALVTVGHSKYWSTWDVVHDEAAFEMQLAETEETVDGWGGKRGDGDGGGESGNEDSSSSDEDEMAALRKSAAAQPAQTSRVTNEENEEEEEEEEEDEMAALRRK